MKQENISHMADGGRVIIPSSIRKSLDLKTGEKLIFSVEEGDIRISTVNSALARAQRLFNQHCKDSTKNTVDDFIQSRREEAKLEERNAERMYRVIKGEE